MDDYRRVIWHKSRKNLYLSFLLPAILLIVGAVSFLSNDRRNGGVFIVAGVLTTIFILLLTQYRVRKQAKYRFERSEPMTVTFSDLDCEMKSKSFSTSFVYDKLSMAEESDHDLIFIPQKNLFIPIAKRFFASSSDLQVVRDRLVDALGERAKLMGHGE